MENRPRGDSWAILAYNGKLHFVANCWFMQIRSHMAIALTRLPLTLVICRRIHLSEQVNCLSGEKREHEKCSLPNHFLFGSTLATSPDWAQDWNGAGFTTRPLRFLERDRYTHHNGITPWTVSQIVSTPGHFPSQPVHLQPANGGFVPHCGSSAFPLCMSILIT